MTIFSKKWPFLTKKSHNFFGQFVWGNADFFGFRKKNRYGILFSLPPQRSWFQNRNFFKNSIFKIDHGTTGSARARAELPLMSFWSIDFPIKMCHLFQGKNHTAKLFLKNPLKRSFFEVKQLKKWSDDFFTHRFYKANEKYDQASCRETVNFKKYFILPIVFYKVSENRNWDTCAEIISHKKYQSRGANISFRHFPVIMVMAIKLWS